MRPPAIGAFGRRTIRQQNGRPSSGDGGDVFVRALVLVVLALAANAWSVRHLGVGLEDVWGVVVLSGGLPLGVKIAEWLLGEQKWNGVSDWLRRKLLTTWALVVLAAVGLGVAVSLTSVTLVGPAPADGKPARVLSIADGSEIGTVPFAAGKPARALLATTPFGRDVQLAVGGYQPQIVDLRPFVGVTVDLARDFEPLPTIHFRPDYEALVQMREAGTEFRLFKVLGDGRCDMLARDYAEQGSALGMRSYMVGTRRSIPAERRTLWTLELQARDYDQAAIAEASVAWSRPEWLSVEPMPVAGDRLFAAVVTAAPAVFSAADFVVGRAAIQGVALEPDVAPPAGCDPLAQP